MFRKNHADASVTIGVPGPTERLLYSNSGATITPLAPEGVQFAIDDIAHALSAMPRFAGQTSCFYSVAQHSVWCAEHAPRGLALQALLRDAPRAYLMDVLGPLKRQMPSYCAAESRLRHAILENFGLDPHYASARALQAVDDAALALEWAHLKGDPLLEWFGLPHHAVEQLRLRSPLAPAEAKRLFLDKFRSLTTRGEPEHSPGHAKIDSFVHITRGWSPPNRPEVLTFNQECLDLASPGAPYLRFNLADIALGLSRMPRFAGHTTEPYSVAQHCLMVASLVPPECRLQALLHDASEAYLMDMPSPIKSAFPEYQALEASVEGEIYARFGVTSPEYNKAVIKKADVRALTVECRDLMGHSRHGDFSGSESDVTRISVLSQKQAEEEWTKEVLLLLKPDLRPGLAQKPSGLGGIR